MTLVRNDRFALCLLVLMGLTGCSDEPVGDPPICDVVPAPHPNTAQSSGLMKVGHPFTLLVTPLNLSVCGESRLPTSVTAEIEGPGGEPVEGQIHLGETKAPATLHFTPVRPGPHHILVAFSQVGGVHQFDFHAVVDSSSSAPSYTLDRACTSLERTQQGSWVCDTAVLRGDTEVAAFPNARLAVAGDVIWVLSSTGLQRYLDTGSALVMTGSLNHSQGKATFVLASADELAAIFDGALALYTFSGGTLASAGITPLSRPDVSVGSYDDPYGLLLREGSQFALVTRQITNSQSVVQVCPYQLDSGRLQRTPSPCLQLSGEVVGFEPRVLWTRDPAVMIGTRLEQGIIHRWEWNGGGLVEAGSVSLGTHARLIFPPMVNPSVVPTIYADQNGSFSGSLTAVAVWSAERRAILFEHLDAEVNDLRASPTFYWGTISQSASTHLTKIRLRSQAPIP